MEPWKKKIKIFPEKPEVEYANLWQHQEDLRIKNEEIVRLNRCLREKEEEIFRLKVWVNKLEEELKSVQATNSGVAGPHEYNYSSRGGFSGCESYRPRSNYDNKNYGHYDQFDRNDDRNDRDFGQDQYGRSNDQGYGFSDRDPSKSSFYVQNYAHSSTNNQPSIKKETSDHDDSDDEDGGTANTGGSGKKGKWKRRFCLPLLQAYAKYKMELECTDDSQKRGVWGKISVELFRKISEGNLGKCPTNYDGLLCMEKIEALRKEYERLKNANSISKRKATFFHEAKHAFESDVNTVVPPDTSNKWYKNRALNLLHVYAKHKPQFSRPNINEQAVWKDIASELRVKYSIICNESECYIKIDQLRSNYERMKHQYVPNEEMAMFLDAANQAFESTGTPVSDESFLELLSVKKRKPGFRLRLLLVYTEHRHEFCHPDVQQDKLWDKIAQEMRKFSYNCGPNLCRHELSRMRDQYEYLKGDQSKKLIQPIDMRNLFQEARKAFDD